MGRKTMETKEVMVTMAIMNPMADTVTTPHDEEDQP